ncbi:MAG: hypothetical protein JST67_05040 [Bacteroidetes bacterium]|nr:hypothetical protein [Bacteroidota bacterium]
MEKINNIILQKLYSKRKHLLIIAFLAAAAGYIVTLPFIITPKYRSVAYVYPANMVPFFMEQQSSSVSHTELLMQFLTSNDVKNEVMHRLHLAQHYKLDTLDPKFQVIFDAVFEQRVKFSLTRFESAEIAVLDKNPEMAQLMVSTLIKTTNQLIFNEHEKKFKEFVAVNKVYVESHKKTLDSLKTELKQLGEKYHLVEIESQAREAYKNYYKLLSEGKENVKLSEAVANMNEHAAEFISLDNAVKNETGEYIKAQDNYNQSVRDYNRKLSYTILASAPMLPVEVYYPKRSFVIPICVLASLAFSVLYFIYFEKIQQVWLAMRGKKEQA